MQAYLRELGSLLHHQQRQREDAVDVTRDSCGSSCSSSDEMAVPEGSRVSVTVHEHVQGDLSAGEVVAGGRTTDWLRGGCRTYPRWQAAHQASSLHIKPSRRTSLPRRCQPKPPLPLTCPAVHQPRPAPLPQCP